jgi:hypothetical protein
MFAERRSAATSGVKVGVPAEARHNQRAKAGG